MRRLRFALVPRLAAAVTTAAAASVFAQTAPDPASLPKPACTKPGEYPGRLASDRQVRTWQGEVRAYGDCIKKFAEEQRTIADLHVKAANAAIEEHNAVVKAATDEMKKASE